MRTFSAYLSHPIRGLKGKEATRQDIKLNIDYACMVARKLRQLFQHKIQLYCPAEHDEIIYRLYEKGKLSEKDILDIDVEIMLEKDILFIYSRSGILSRGMKIEQQEAIKAKLPIISFKKLEPWVVQATYKFLNGK